MKVISRFLVLWVLWFAPCSVFASGSSLAFSQSQDGIIYAVYQSGVCPLGLLASLGNNPTVAIDRNQINITTSSVVASYFGQGKPPCNPQLTPGYMLPLALGKLVDGHYTVVWNFYPGQIAGAFDVASGLLVTSNDGIFNSPAVSGLWYDHSYTGSGFSLLLSKAGFLVSYFGWDAKGNRLWLVSDLGPTSLRLNTPIVLNMSYTTDGIFSTPQNKLVRWGTFVLNFTSCQVATASLNGKDGTQDLYLTQLVGITGPGC